MFRNLTLLALIATLPHQAQAFDVDVFTSNGDLIIVGDGDPNNVIIEPVDATRVRVTGGQTGPFNIWPTFINGTSARSGVFTVQGSIFIDLRGNSDELTIRDVVFQGQSASFNVLMGSGNDDVVFENVFVNAAINIDLGSGHDDLVFESVISSATAINGRSGDDNIQVFRSAPGRIQINSGRHNDDVWIYDVDMETLGVNLESGDDTLGLYRSSLRNTRQSTLVGGSGRDGLLLPYFPLVWNFNSFNEHAIATGFE